MSVSTAGDGQPQPSKRIHPVLPQVVYPHASRAASSLRCATQGNVRPTSISPSQPAGQLTAIDLPLDLPYWPHVRTRACACAEDRAQGSTDFAAAGTKTSYVRPRALRCSGAHVLTSSRPHGLTPRPLCAGGGASAASPRLGSGKEGRSRAGRSAHVAAILQCLMARKQASNQGRIRTRTRVNMHFRPKSESRSGSD